MAKKKSNVNGAAASGSDKLNPGRTDFDRRQQYYAYNISDFVLPGRKNALAVWLGQGWQSMPGHQPVARVLVAYLGASDAVVAVVATDNASWVGTREGPITDNDIYRGEV